MAIKIYCYHGLDLALIIAKIIQNILETAKKGSNMLLKTKDFIETKLIL